MHCRASFLTYRRIFGKLDKVDRVFGPIEGGGNLQGNTRGIFLRGFKAFKAPLLILDKVERLCRPMEREGGNLGGNTRRILLRRFQGPFSFKTMTNGRRGLEFAWE